MIIINLLKYFHDFLAYNVTFIAMIMWNIPEGVAKDMPTVFLRYP
jgi:hypothetical protein